VTFIISILVVQLLIVFAVLLFNWWNWYERDRTTGDQQINDNLWQKFESELIDGQYATKFNDEEQVA